MGLTGGEPNEVVTLSFQLSYTGNVNIAKSIIFDSIAVLVDKANMYATANVTLDANGLFSSTFTITGLTSCTVTIIGRDSIQQIPTSNTVFINNINPDTEIFL